MNLITIHHAAYRNHYSLINEINCINKKQYATKIIFDYFIFIHTKCPIKIGALSQWLEELRRANFFAVKMFVFQAYFCTLKRASHQKKSRKLKQKSAILENITKQAIEKLHLFFDKRQHTYTLVFRAPNDTNCRLAINLKNKSLFWPFFSAVTSASSLCLIALVRRT